MKKACKIIIAAAAITLLTGCRGRGRTTTSGSDVPTSGSTTGTTGTTVTPTTTGSSVDPAKTGWTSDEKAMFADYLIFELPFLQGSGLTISMDEDDGVFIATGKTTTQNDVDSYAALLEDESYVIQEFAEGTVSEDLGEIIELQEGACQYRKSESANSVYSQVVAVGLNASNQLTVVFTVGYAYWGMSFWNELTYIPLGDGITLDLVYEANEENFEFGNTYFEESGAEVCYYENEAVYTESSTCSGIGIEDFCYSNPFTSGNFYSPYFFTGVQFFYFEYDEDEIADYDDALVQAGYTLEEDTGDWTSYYKEGTYGICEVNYIFFAADELIEGESVFLVEIDFVLSE